MEDREQRIREIAYRIWVDEGFPTDQDRRHWRMASLIVEQEDAERAALKPAASDAPKKFLAQRS